MSATVDFESLKTFGQVAAPAGLAISAFFILAEISLQKIFSPS